jgi:hypothetical protein
MTIVRACGAVGGIGLSSSRSAIRTRRAKQASSFVEGAGNRIESACGAVGVNEETRGVAVCSSGAFSCTAHVSIRAII